MNLYISRAWITKKLVEIREKCKPLYEDGRKEITYEQKTLLGIIPIVVFAALQTAISELRMDLSIKEVVKEEIANQKSEETEGE